jgi:hypothetical protein
MAPKGIKITIRSIKILSFPLNLLLNISIMAIIGISNTKIKIKGIINKNGIISILLCFYW